MRRLHRLGRAQDGLETLLLFKPFAQCNLGAAHLGDVMGDAQHPDGVAMRIRDQGARGLIQAGVAAPAVRQPFLAGVGHTGQANRVILRAQALGEIPVEEVDRALADNGVLACTQQCLDVWVAESEDAVAVLEPHQIRQCSEQDTQAAALLIQRQRMPFALRARSA